MERQRCRDCRWFLKYTGQEIGQCRRYSPTENTDAGWLEVSDFDWCGEYADNNDIAEETKRRDLIRQFALALVASGSEAMVHQVWQRAAEFADYEGQV